MSFWNKNRSNNTSDKVVDAEVLVDDAAEVVADIADTDIESTTEVEYSEGQPHGEDIAVVNDCDTDSDEEGEGDSTECTLSGFNFIDDEIDNQPIVVTAVDNTSEKERKQKSIIEAEHAVKIRTISHDAPHINQIDMAFMKLWSIIAGLISLIAAGINSVVKLIFKRELPKRYVRAFVSFLLIVGILLAIILPLTLSYDKDEDSLGIFNCGLVPVKVSVGDEYKWGYAKESKVDDHLASESWQIKPEFDMALPFCKYKVAWVCNVEEGEEKWHLINTKGKRLSSVSISEVGRFADNKLCKVKSGNNYGYINTKGDLKIQAVYEDAGDFIDGIARVRSNGREFYINDKTKRISVGMEYDQVYDFTDGMGAVSKDGKWGFVDKSGNEKISRQYDAVTPFIEGYAMVKSGKTFGIINTKGKSIVSSSEYYDIYVDHPLFRLFTELLADDANIDDVTQIMGDIEKLLDYIRDIM